MKTYKKFTLILLCAALVLVCSCNKEKRLMEGLVGNWNIEKSERAYLNFDGTEDIYETIDNAGKLVISEDPNNPSKTMRLYDFMFIDANQDTLQQKDSLITDEDNKRIIFLNALVDSNGVEKNLVWTIEKEKKNKQIWSCYGVDSTFFYPENNNNPGDAANSLVWRLTLKRE